MEFLRRHLGLILRIAISVTILGWLAHKIEWAELGRRIQSAEPAGIVVALVLFGVTLFLSAVRWQILLRVQEIPLRLAPIFQVSMIGQFFNSFLLGTTGGDVVKILYVAQLAPHKKSAAGLSVLLDRVIGLTALIVLTVGLSASRYRLLTSTAQSAQALWTFYLIAAGVAGVLTGAALLPVLLRFANLKRLEKKLPFHEQIERISEAFARNSRNPGANLEALLLSFVAHLLNLFSQYAVMRALHLDVSFVTVASVTAIILVLISIPISVAGLGVRESLFVLFLGLSGVSREGAIAASLIGFSISLAWSIVGGVIHLRYKNPQPPLSAVVADGAAS